MQDTLGSASDKADHHASKASKEGQSYLDSAKDQANSLFGQTQVQPQQLGSCFIFYVCILPLYPACSSALHTNTVSCHLGLKRTVRFLRSCVLHCHVMCMYCW